jgi:hypothetical protein
MEELKSSKEAAREDWRAARVQWQMEIKKPPWDREYFQVGEIAEEVALQPERLEADERVFLRSVFDQFKQITRGEFEETDVLMLVGGPQLFAPFLPAYRAACEYAQQQSKRVWHEPRPRGADRPAIELRHHPDSEVISEIDKFISSAETTPTGAFESAAASRTAGQLVARWVEGLMYAPRFGADVNLGAIILRRRAVRRYLEDCALDGVKGAMRLLRKWFGSAEAAAEPTAVPAPLAANGGWANANGPNQAAKLSNAQEYIKGEGEKPPIPALKLRKHMEAIKSAGGPIPAADFLVGRVGVAFPQYRVTRDDVRTMHAEVWGKQPCGRRRKDSAQ